MVGINKDDGLIATGGTTQSPDSDDEDFYYVEPSPMPHIPLTPIIVPNEPETPQHMNDSDDDENVPGETEDSDTTIVVSPPQIPQNNDQNDSEYDSDDTIFVSPPAPARKTPPEEMDDPSEDSSDATVSPEKKRPHRWKGYSHDEPEENEEEEEEEEESPFPIPPPQGEKEKREAEMVAEYVRQRSLAADRNFMWTLAEITFNATLRYSKMNPLWKDNYGSTMDLPGAPGMFLRHDPFHTYFMQILLHKLNEQVHVNFDTGVKESGERYEGPSLYEKQSKVQITLGKITQWHIDEMSSYLVYLARLTGNYRTDWYRKISSKLNNLEVLLERAIATEKERYALINLLKEIGIIRKGVSTIPLERAMDTLLIKAYSFHNYLRTKYSDEEILLDQTRDRVKSAELFYLAGWTFSIGVCSYIAEHKRRYMNNLGNLRMIRPEKSGGDAFLKPTEYGTPIDIHFETRAIKFFDESGVEKFFQVKDLVVITFTRQDEIRNKAGTLLRKEWVNNTVHVPWEDWVKMPSSHRKHFLPEGAVDELAEYETPDEEPEEGEIVDQASPEYRKRRRISSLMELAFNDKATGIESIRWNLMDELLKEIDEVISDTGFMKVSQDFDQWKNNSKAVSKYKDNFKYDKWVKDGKMCISKALSTFDSFKGVKKQDDLDFLASVLSDLHIGLTGEDPL
jgi:hypothetical protein